MTETVEASSAGDAAATTAPRRRKAGGGLEGMLLPELKQLAGTLGIKGTGELLELGEQHALEAATSLAATRRGGRRGVGAGGFNSFCHVRSFPHGSSRCDSTIDRFMPTAERSGT